MNEEKKEKRCIACKKLLINKKLPLCRRCCLEGRNKVVQIAGAFGGSVTAAVSVAMFMNKNGNGDNDTTT